MEGINFWISYFYNIRFLPVDIIPVSTAISDPCWYKGEPRQDNRGVFLGIRFPELHHPVPKDCGCPCYLKNPQGCDFLKTYKNHLDLLDWDKLIWKFGALKDYLEKGGYPVSGFCLMVYERPDNPCSERWALINYFKKHGIKLKEWKRS